MIDMCNTSKLDDLMEKVKKIKKELQNVYVFGSS